VWPILAALFAIVQAVAHGTAATLVERRLYAVDQAAGDRGSISVYDIDADHRLVKTIETVPDISDVRGVAAAAGTGRLYVAYRNDAGTGGIYCLDLYGDRILWNKPVDPGVDRLAINPDGQLLYVPSWEGGTADYINVVDAETGDVVRRVYFSNHSHDTQYPLSGPVFQSTKARDGSGKYLYRIDPQSYAVSRVGPYAGVLGPYAVDGRSRYVVNDVTGLWGMQVADLGTGRIITAIIPDHPQRDPGLMHGIGWTPDETEVWQSGGRGDPHVYIWNMSRPLAAVLKGVLRLNSGRGTHWLTLDIRGDYGYVAPQKKSGDGTEIFAVRGHSYVGTIASSEDMLEIDFENGKIIAVGDQYGIGRH
jgi:hypothetical protein